MVSIKGIIKDVIIVAVCISVIWIGVQSYFGTPNPFYVVSSGSMYPELAMYDIIVVTGHAQFDDVRVGDIIVFDRPKDQAKVIVHRVVAVIEDDQKILRTKGDNNQASIPGTDFPITAENYIGTVDHVIPQVGFITKILQPPINYIIIAVIIGIMVIRQISKGKSKKSLEVNSIDESKPDLKINELLADDEYIKSKDSRVEESKFSDKLDQEDSKPKDLPEFFRDKEKQSEEKE